MQQHSISTLKC